MSSWRDSSERTQGAKPAIQSFETSVAVTGGASGLGLAIAIELPRQTHRHNHRHTVAEAPLEESVHRRCIELLEVP
jgi:hypothetical protein